MNKAKTSTKEISVFALYVKHIGFLSTGYVLSGLLLGVFMYNVLTPFFHQEIQNDIRNTLKTIEPDLVPALLREDFDSAYKIIERASFKKPIQERSLHVFTIDNYGHYGLKHNCIGAYQEKDFAEFCKNPKEILISLPIKAADNTLAHVQFKVTDDVSSWNPFRIMLGCIAFAITTCFVVTLFLIMRFRKKFAGPIENAVDEISKVSDIQDFPKILPKIRLKEVRSVSQALSKKSQELHCAKLELSQLKVDHEVTRITKQVLHDIKIPISTISAMIEKIRIESTIKSKFLRLLDQISEIAEAHLRKDKADALKELTSEIENNSNEGKINKSIIKEKNSTFVSSLGGALKTCIDEIKVAKAKSEIEIIEDISKKAFLQFVAMDFIDLTRVINNLLMNAIEASAENNSPKVYTSIQIKEKTCEILVKDFGKGFDASVLEAIQKGEKKSTKATGHGMGILGSRHMLHQCGGDLTITSTPTGSVVRIILPSTTSPTWFFNIAESSNENIICLDDDAAIAIKLKSFLPEKTIHVTTNEDDFFDKLKTDSAAMLLVDFDFGGTMTGLDLIQSNRLQDRAVLVSGKISFDEQLRVEAQAKSVRMFPKECLG